MRKILAVIFLAMALFVSGCNTVSGLGKDISGAADAVKKM